MERILLFRKTTLTVFYLLVGFHFADALAITATKEFTLKLVDTSNQSGVNDAHICIELSDGYQSYHVSNSKGEILIKLSDAQEGSIVISKVGYVTQYLSPDKIKNGMTIPFQPDIFDIDQVIITGQGKPTPIDSSIYKVKLITAKKIQQSGSVNLGELLMAESNIRISTDATLGTEIEMLGLSGQNVKVMIDGVPVIGRLGGNIDLSQINLNNIAQVEIIEGPMSVVYGNNALAGTINLITKQSHYNTSIQANALTESVGRYNGNINLSQKFNHHNITLDGGYEYFSGVDFDTSNRSMDWRPKTQKRVNGTYRFAHNNWDVAAKAGIFTGELLIKGDQESKGSYYQAIDSKYFTDRLDFSTHINKQWDKQFINVVSSYNTFKRSSQEITKNLTTLSETSGEIEVSQEATQIIFRGIYGYSWSKVSAQTGIDLNSEGMTGERIKDGKGEIGDYALFLNLKYKPWNKFEVQPGFRYAYNTKYNAPIVYSLNTKWNLNPSLNWRTSLARGFRAPTVKELFMYFHDSNHNIDGNPDLKAESSYNINTTFEFSKQGKIHSWNFSAAAYYNDIDNMIDTSIDTEASTDDTNWYKYFNIEEFKSAGSNIELKYGYKKLFTIRAGYGITARYNTYTKQNASRKYNITHDAFAGLRFTEPTTGIILYADYKYNGKLPYYTTNDDDEIVEGIQDPYHTLNASLNKHLFKNKLNISVGAKNLTDVTSVSRSAGSSSAHSGDSTSLPVSYGRTYFINLTYKFNKTIF